MKKRMILMSAAIAVFLSVVGFVKYNQIKAAIAQHAAITLPPEAITTIVAARDKWPVTLEAIGTVTAENGVVVSADLPGIVGSIQFKSGASVHSGEILARLDTKQEEAQLAAAEAQQHLSNVNLDRMRVLRQQGVAAQAELDQIEAEAMQADAH